MGLVDLKTNLRTLKYGRDRAGGTSSNEPYIKKRLTTDYNYTPGSDDYLGIDSIGRQGTSLAAAEDVSRLTKFFNDGKSARGSLFTLKQKLLSLNGPQTPYGPTRGTFSNQNLILQAGASGTGIHYNSLGGLPESPFFTTYEFLTKQLYSGNGNRLSILYKNKILKQSPRELGAGGTAAALAFGIDLFLDNNVLGSILTYGGGANSPITIIKRTTNTSTYKPGGGKDGQYKNIFALDSQAIGNKLRLTSTGLANNLNSNSSISNFMLDVVNKSTDDGKRVLGRLTNYGVFNRVQKYGTGDQGNDANLDRQAYFSGAPVKTAGVDLINYNTLYSSNEVKTGQGYDDIIKFYIAVLNNDNPELKTYIHFRAYLKGLSDSFGASWDSFKYMGRGEDFYKYNGFSRGISLSFDILVGSRIELFPVYDKLNYLGSIMAPDYSKGGFMRGNIIQLTVGDYINNVYGVLDGINYSFPDDSSWDIARKDDGEIDENSAELPLLINVSSFNFKPIHNFVPSTVNSKSNPYNSGNSRFISLGDTGRGYGGEIAINGNARLNQQ